MIYVIQTKEGVTEIREDQYPLADGAVEITEDEKNGLMDQTLIFQNGKIVKAS